MQHLSKATMYAAFALISFLSLNISSVSGEIEIVESPHDNNVSIRDAIGDGSKGLEENKISSISTSIGSRIDQATRCRILTVDQSKFSTQALIEVGRLEQQPITGDFLLEYTVDAKTYLQEFNTACKDVSKGKTYLLTYVYGDCAPLRLIPVDYSPFPKTIIQDYPYCYSTSCVGVDDVNRAIFEYQFLDTCYASLKINTYRQPGPGSGCNSISLNASFLALVTLTASLFIFV